MNNKNYWCISPIIFIVSWCYIKIIYFFLNIILVIVPKIKTGIVAPNNIPITDINENSYNWTINKATIIKYNNI